MKILKDTLKNYGIELSSLQEEQFQTYSDFLIKTNKEFNLTAITEPADIELFHFVDSIKVIPSLLEYMNNDLNTFGQLKLIDIGTGAGFPGMVLKILFPKLDLTLLDSLGKRIKFLDETYRMLGLENVICIHGRAEDIAHYNSYRGKFDIAIARAVAPLPVLCEYCLPFVKKEGIFAAMKSKFEEEIEISENAINILGGEIIGIHKYYLNEEDKDIYRSLIVTKKINETPGIFPRKAGIPKKNPL